MARKKGEETMPVRLAKRVINKARRHAKLQGRTLRADMERLIDEGVDRDAHATRQSI